MTAPNPPGPPQVAVGAVVLDEGRLLTVRRARPPAAGRWTLPGGRVEAGEAVRDAVRREVREETGLEVEVAQLLGFAEHLDDERHYVILDFLAHARTEATAVAGDDAAEVAWMTATQLRQAGPTEGLLDHLTRWGVVLAP